MRAYVLAISLLVLLLGGTAFYIQQRFAALAQDNYEPPPTMIAAGVAKMRTWRETIDAVGTIRAAQGILMNAETSGDITKLHVQSGQFVEVGQLLISIDEQIEVATRRRLEARRELAEQLYSRDLRLIKENSIPQSQLDQSSADYRSADAELAEIDAILNNKRITAPFSGRLGILQVRLGDYVEAATPLVTLQDISQLEVDFSVPDRYAPLMRPGLKVSLRTAAFPDRRFLARLEAVDAQVDENTRNLLLRANLEDGEGLLPGMFASLQVDVDQESQRVFVPETAVTYSLQGDLVYVIEKDERGLFVTPRVVVPGGGNEGQVSIMSGISAGEQVVIAGQNKLYRGARVEIDPEVSL